MPLVFVVVDGRGQVEKRHYPERQVVSTDPEKGRRKNVGVSLCERRMGRRKKVGIDLY